MYWEPYVPVGVKKLKAEQLGKKLKKQGKEIQPVIIKGRSIATSFWGKSWCKNLESYQDLAYRLERGRSYVRHSAVVDLKVKSGVVEALVSGSSLYKVKVEVSPLARDTWHIIREKCSLEISSLIELIQGKLSSGVMEVVSKKGEGLFPHPDEIKMNCSCPDYAVMCKHVAATLYGVGSRLDDDPESLFLLRGVDPRELVGQVDVFSSAGEDEEMDIEDIFQIEVDERGLDASSSRAKVATARPRKKKSRTVRKRAVKKKATGPVKKKKVAKKVVLKKAQKKKTASKKPTKKTGGVKKSQKKKPVKKKTGR